ncbi:hypothetical protein FQN49_007040 [Arthroderma sp. PD_2]|nr:hypothetical protein FQN49_007040 [Arthroderma sp. PD_2]
MSLRGGNQSSPNQRPSWSGRRPETLRGLLVDGIWQCDCDPRRTANHFETKNGGKNHGRWFYTCPKPRDKGCGFFLWEDAANERAAAQKPVDDEDDDIGVAELYSAQIRDERGNQGPLLQTPKANRFRDSVVRGGLLTPESQLKRKRDGDIVDYLDQDQSPTKRGRSSLSTAQSTRQDMSPSTAENQDVSYPSLASRLEILDAEPIPQPPLFSTPNKSTHSPGSVARKDQGTWPDIPSTPTPSRFASSPFRLHSSEGNNKLSKHCELAKKVFDLLESHKVHLSPETRQDLAGLLDMNDLRTLGIIKGRDISRLAIKEREERIEGLQSRISVLEAERESWRTLLSLNKRDTQPSYAVKPGDDSQSEAF